MFHLINVEVVKEIRESQLGQVSVMISNNRQSRAQPQIRKVWKTIRGGIEKRGKPDGGTDSEKSQGKTVSRLKMDASELELAKP
jgi:hypothetical protein